MTDPDVVGPDGSTIKAKLTSLVQGTEQDIKDCASQCDAWAKKHILLKVIMGPAWEDKLAGFAAAFNRRREEFAFILQVHTTVGVDQIQALTKIMDEK